MNDDSQWVFALLTLLSVVLYQLRYFVWATYILVLVVGLLPEIHIGRLVTLTLLFLALLSHLRIGVGRLVALDARDVSTRGLKMVR